MLLCRNLTFSEESSDLLISKLLSFKTLHYFLTTGAGFGLMIAASYSTFNAYFVKKRIMMMSFAQSIFGLGTMAYPIFVQYFMEQFGYRGFMAIRASVHGHVIFAMLVMQPVQWHMKKIMREDELLVDGGEGNLVI